MTATNAHIPTPGEPPARSRRLPTAVGFAVGAALLLAALWALRGQPAAIRHAWSSLRGADPALWALVLGLPLLNCVLSAEAFLPLTRRFTPPGVKIPRAEMLALVAAAWLLNFLPLRPGLVGRIAFHRTRHGVRVRDSARVLVEVIACAAAALALLSLAVLARPLAGVTPLAALLILAPCLLLSTTFSRGAEGSPTARAFLAVFAVKLIDSFVWSLRYLLAFQLAGRPVGFDEAVALAIVAQAASLIPLAGNGLGLREWAVGLLTAALPAWYGASDPGAHAADGLALGLSAEVVNRLAEIAVAIPAGLLGAFWVSRLARRPSPLPEPPNPAA